MIDFQGLSDMNKLVLRTEAVEYLLTIKVTQVNSAQNRKQKSRISII